MSDSEIPEVPPEGTQSGKQRRAVQVDPREVDDPELRGDRSSRIYRFPGPEALT